jgi:hypothetical protein
VVTESECGRRAGRSASAVGAGGGADAGGAIAGGLGAGGAGGGAFDELEAPALGALDGLDALGAAGGLGEAGDRAGRTPGSGGLLPDVGDARPPRAGGAGGGVTIMVGSRSRSLPDAAPGSGVLGGGSLADWVRGTLGKPPARDGVRGSGDADEVGASSPMTPDVIPDAAPPPGPLEPDPDPAPAADAEGEGDDGEPALDRRDSRCGPGQSQIDRGASPPAAPDVANAGVSPGSGGPLDEVAGIGAAAGWIGGAIWSRVTLISGSS